MLCTLLAGIELWRAAKRPLAGAGLFGGGLLAALAGAWLTGAVGSGVAVSRYGYGEISMNLNALFNPSSRGGYTWSRLLPQQAQNPSQYDGFNYLGLGVLALVASALLYSIWRTARRPADTAAWWRRNGPLFAACAFLTLFAVTNNITFGSWTLSIPSRRRSPTCAASSAPAGGCFIWWPPAWCCSACTRCAAPAPGRTRPRGGAGRWPAGCWRWSAPCSCGTCPLWRPKNGRCLIRSPPPMWSPPPRPRPGRRPHPPAGGVPPAGGPNPPSGHPGRQAGACHQHLHRRFGPVSRRRGPGPQAGEQLLAGQYDPDTVYVTTDGAQYEQWQSIYAATRT